MVLSWERARIIVRSNSFCRVPWLQCLSTPVVRFVNDLRIVEVSNVIKSPRVFCDVWAFSTMLYVPHVYFSPSSKAYFSFANVAPGARCACNFIDDIALVIFSRSKLRDRENPHIQIDILISIHTMTENIKSAPLRHSCTELWISPTHKLERPAKLPVLYVNLYLYTENHQLSLS